MCMDNLKDLMINFTEFDWWGPRACANTEFEAAPAAMEFPDAREGVELEQAA